MSPSGFGAFTHNPARGEQQVPPAIATLRLSAKRAPRSTAPSGPCPSGKCCDSCCAGDLPHPCSTARRHPGNRRRSGAGATPPGDFLRRRKPRRAERGRDVKRESGESGLINGTSRECRVSKRNVTGTIRRTGDPTFAHRSPGFTPDTPSRSGAAKPNASPGTLRRNQ